MTCPYTDGNFVLMPKVLLEIMTHYQVDGIFGNRVATLGTCYCKGCQTLYQAATGTSIPLDTSPNTAQGRQYWEWSEQRYLQLIDLRPKRCESKEWDRMPGFGSVSLDERPTDPKSEFRLLRARWAG
jgi:hypothetical protein